ncbi:hypothetical protein Cch01nite_38510 [Cellulomonas chitinilytica]|uniref:Uncharacterized protein n=1 Tax=Cellulomonas chitinilytica TaxID=398759 RepID=A0A919P4B7_9CELL|nr:hypothetical protein Cch01nite_38510 [Cellulomonas chitinilytica]
MRRDEHPADERGAEGDREHQRDREQDDRAAGPGGRGRSHGGAARRTCAHQRVRRRTRDHDLVDRSARWDGEARRQARRWDGAARRRGRR